MGRGPGWSTKLFGSEEELVYFLSTRGGVKPAFPKKTKISVRTLEPPAPDHMADIKEKGRLLDEKIPSIVTGICDQFNARNK